jgi:hypothetical protein
MEFKYLALFSIIFLFVLSITNAGIYINDEWMTAETLHQLAEGHQITFNEGKYGYYANGTAGSYMQFRNNILMYSAPLPIVSLPVFLLFSLFGDNFRLLIVFLSLLPIVIIIKYFKSHFITITSLIYLLLNLLLYSEFPFNGQFIPSEVIAIVYTNIILFSIFAVTWYKNCEILFKDKALLSWIIIMSCSSILIWVSTLKDHVLIATLIALLIYFLLSIAQTRDDIKFLALCGIINGIIIWIRPEIGIFIFIALFIYSMTSSYSYIIPVFYLFFTITGAIPALINNIMVTQNPLKFPFTAANPEYNITTITSTYVDTPSFLSSLNIFISPYSGAISILVIFSLFILSLFLYKKKYDIDLLLLIIGISSILGYIIIARWGLNFDFGLLPDIRYLTPAQAPLTAFALIVIYKTFEIDIKTTIKKIILYTILIFVIEIGVVSLISQNITFQSFNSFTNAAICIAFGLAVIALINDLRLKTKYFIKTLPLLVAIPLAWQLIIAIMWSMNKVNAYPHIMPLAEVLYKMMVGG